MQVARKVVGVGSVNAWAWVLLMDATNRVEPLFLQAKEKPAVPSWRSTAGAASAPTRASRSWPGSA